MKSMLFPGLKIPVPQPVGCSPRAARAQPVTLTPKPEALGSIAIDPAAHPPLLQRRQFWHRQMRAAPPAVDVFPGSAPASHPASLTVDPPMLRAR